MLTITLAVSLIAVAPIAGDQKVPLGKILSSSPSDQHINMYGANADPNDKSLNELFEVLRERIKPLVLVCEGDYPKDYVRDMLKILKSSKRDFEYDVSRLTSEKGLKRWLVVYVGSGCSTPVLWNLKSATQSEGQFVVEIDELSFEQSRERTLDVKYYAYWIPLYNSAVINNVIVKVNDKPILKLERLQKRPK